MARTIDKDAQRSRGILSMAATYAVAGAESKHQAVNSDDGKGENRVIHYNYLNSVQRSWQVLAWIHNITPDTPDVRHASVASRYYSRVSQLCRRMQGMVLQHPGIRMDHKYQLQRTTEPELQGMAHTSLGHSIQVSRMDCRANIEVLGLPYQASIKTRTYRRFRAHVWRAT